MNPLAKLQLPIPKLVLLIAAFTFFSTIVAVYGLWQLNKLAPVISNSISPSKIKIQHKVLDSGQIVIDIEGAIEKPGVYELSNKSRLLTALKTAGGLSPEADRYLIAKNFNLAQKLHDEEKIYLPFLEERNESVLGISTQLLTSLNAANLSQLELLPGIGPVRGQKIIDHRPYQNLEELISKKIVGEATFAKLTGLICL